ncbi:hypothetical protein HZH66_000746 [Vespula vulgaris]|uniref:Uncharacterized protein n=1 Tax=Vespula vulgaris TaxID=7454 RepID=A0A834KT02_VESVU|nr:hypothetical protein HZH66_000746 [Vespula vulgaris]
MVPNVGRFNANDILTGVREKHGLTSRADDDLRANKFALLEFPRVSYDVEVFFRYPKRENTRWRNTSRLQTMVPTVEERKSGFLKGILLYGKAVITLTEKGNEQKIQHEVRVEERERKIEYRNGWGMFSGTTSQP